MVTSTLAGPEVGILASAALSEAATAIAERVTPSVVVVGHQRGNGAGVIWRSDGLIVTNRHVVHADRTEVQLADGRRFPANIVARSNDRDLALLKIDIADLPAIEVGDSATARPGQLVLAIGHPIGYRGAVTAGVIVAAGQAATTDGPRTGDWLQADVTLLPGNSGGPLLDVHGRVIGINTMVSGELSLAIPSQAVEYFIAGRAPGAIEAYLGLSGVVVPLRRADHPAGLVLTEIVEGAPADRAGLTIGDIIVALDDHTVVDQESLPATLMRLKPGQAVSVATLRGGEPRSFTVVPTERT